MQIMIELPQKLCTEIKQSYSIRLDDKSTDKIIKAIKNGTVIPEHHGDLVDKDELWDAYNDLDYDFYEAYDSVPTILEGTVKE